VTLIVRCSKRQCVDEPNEVLPSESKQKVSGIRVNAERACKKTDIIDTLAQEGAQRPWRVSNNLAGSARGGHQVGTKLKMQYFRCPVVFRRIKYSTETGYDFD
jgi:hypothetical protein